MKNVFKNLFSLVRAKMKQSSHRKISDILPDVPDMGVLGSGGRISGRVVKAGPALRKFRKERKVRNKMAARSRRINRMRTEEVSI